MNEKKYNIGTHIYDENAFQRILEVKEIVKNLQKIQDTIYSGLINELKPPLDETTYEDDFLFDFIFNECGSAKIVIDDGNE